MEGGIETGRIAILENVIFTDLTKRSVIAEDPGRVIEFLNQHCEPDRILYPNNEYHFEVGQEILTFYLKLN